jgi:hypothetical protein
MLGVIWTFSNKKRLSHTVFQCPKYKITVELPDKFPYFLYATWYIKPHLEEEHNMERELKLRG